MHRLVQSEKVTMRLTSCFVLFLGLLTGLAFGSPARAELIGDTRVPYSADRTVVTGGKTYIARVYALPCRQRHEQAIRRLSPMAILRSDQGMARVLPTDPKLYA